MLLLVAAGKGSGASLPYQDPTPVLLAVQHGQLQTAKGMAVSGGILVVAGFVWIVGRRFRGPSSAS